MPPSKSCCKVIDGSFLRSCAAQVGLNDIGWAQADYLSEAAPVLQRWLESGHQGSMAYMERNMDKRLDPRLLVPGTRTIVVGVLSYYKDGRQPAGAPYIAMSGLSERDYHEVMKEKMSRLETLLKKAYGEQIVDEELQHVFCDSAPVLERQWALRSGLGYVGRNHQFIHPKLGSFVHLGELFLREPVTGDAYEAPQDTLAPLCKGCTRCLQACPTGALREDEMQSNRCVSYLTIERKESLPDEFKGKSYIGLYGCDNCQRVCPYNKALVPDLTPELAARPELLEMTQADWQATSRRQRLKLLRRLAPDS